MLKIRKNKIKKNIKNSELDQVRYKQLNWYGHFGKINELRISQNILEEVQSSVLSSWWVEGILIIGVRPGSEPRNDYFRETDNQVLLQN